MPYVNDVAQAVIQICWVGIVYFGYSTCYDGY